MKQSQLKALVKEIVTQVMDAANPPKPKPYEEVQGWSFAKGDNRVDFESVLLPDGREVNISVEFEGRWDDGAFDYEYGSIRGTHRYPLSFEVDKVTVTYAEDPNTKQRILPLDNAIVAAGEALFDDYEKSILESMPEPDNEPDPDQGRDDLDR